MMSYSGSKGKGSGSYSKGSKGGSKCTTLHFQFLFGMYPLNFHDCHFTKAAMVTTATARGRAVSV
jgi:hypothetical protein